MTDRPDLSPSPGATAAAIDVMCLRMSIKATGPRGVATGGAAAAVAWVLSTEVSWWRLAPWLACLLALAGHRIVWAWWFHRRPRSDDEVWSRRPTFAASSVLNASAWGALIAVTGFSTSVTVNTAILLAIGGMMAAGSHSMALTPGLMRSSIFLSITPITLHMLFSGDPVLRVMVILVAGYVLAMLGAVKVNYREACESIRLRFVNHALVERLELEKQREREARQSAETANREKTRFLAAASHDVRQPLHAMGLFLDTLKAQPLDARALSLVGSIDLAHGSLTSLHEGLLDVATLDAAVSAPKPRPVRARALLEVLEAEARPRADERRLTLKLAAADVTVLNDPDALLRILRNLVANALAYTEQGKVLVTVRRREGHALVQVWDTGIGIAADQLGLIFEELYQVDNRARERRKGLGLGLSIVQRLARSLGFEVKVRSVPGKGSVFSFAVPLAPAGAQPVELHAPLEGPAARLAPAVLHPPRVAASAVALLVDDDPLARAALAAMLEHWGYEVVAAESAEDALEYAGELERLDVVVSDLWLPGRSGLELLTELGKREPAPRRVLISGDTDPRSAENARAAGATFVRKPVRAAGLREALDGERRVAGEGAA